MKRAQYLAVPGSVLIGDDFSGLVDQPTFINWAAACSPVIMAPLWQ